MTKRALARAALVAAATLAACACAAADDDDTVVIAASAVGVEGDVLEARVREFEAAHRGVHVEIREAPAGGDERNQLYVQWLAAGARTPDLLQIDLVTTAELAAAGFLAPIDEATVDGFFDSALAAVTVTDAPEPKRIYAAPWFVDVGVLYWRTDVFARAPKTLDELAAFARSDTEPRGYAFEGARYEGLVCNYLEVLAGMGGSMIDDDGDVAIDSAAGVSALAFLVNLVGSASPSRVTSFQEEEARFAFENGDVALMRNWPYAAPLLEGPDSRVAHELAVAPFPGDGVHRGRGALGGQALAINARAAHKDLARSLLRFLVDDDAEIERARVAGEAPPRRSLYDGDQLDGALPFAKSPADARALFEAAVARPASPSWSELSGVIAAHLHAALTGQSSPRDALTSAAHEMRAALVRNHVRGTVGTSRAAASTPASRTSRAAAPAPAPGAAKSRPRGPFGLATLLASAFIVGAFFVGALLLAGVPRRTRVGRDARFGWRLALPCIFLVLVTAGIPLVLTIVDSMLDLDLRAPWRGAPFVGLANYGEALTSTRFLTAALHTALFALCTVSLELVLGTAAALLLSSARRARGALRSVFFLPWAVPTVVSALVWRVFFASAAPHIAFFNDAHLAWIPIVVADVWKSTPFVTLIVLAGLTQIDPALDDAARIDGASARQRFLSITLPLLQPTLAVAAIFRLLDAIRVFDVIYVLTGGGPGTATEPLSLLAYDAFMRDLRFGAGSAVSMLLFGVALVLAVIYARASIERDSS